MRVLKVVIFGAVMMGAATTAHAFDKFIPTGTGYSTEVSKIAPLNSDAQAFIAQTDIYESEVYRKQLETRQNESYLKHFFANSDSSSPDFSVDY